MIVIWICYIYYIRTSAYSYQFYSFVINYRGGVPIKIFWVRIRPQYLLTHVRTVPVPYDQNKKLFFFSTFKAFFKNLKINKSLELWWFSGHVASTRSPLLGSILGPRPPHRVVWQIALCEYCTNKVLQTRLWWAVACKKRKGTKYVWFLKSFLKTWKK